MKSFTEFKENINEAQMKMSYREWLTKTGKNHSPENVELYKKTQKEEVDLKESVKIVDRDFDLDQQHFKLHVNGKPEYFVHHNYEDSHEKDSKDEIHYQVKRQLKHLSPADQKKVTNVIHSSYRVKEEVELDESAEQKWWNTYKNNEKINAHSENIVHLANLVGDNKDKKEATEILKKHRDVGYLTQDLHDRRYALHKKLFPKVNKHFRMNEDVNLDESADFIQQHLADKDINSKVEGNTVKVHSSDVASAKKHLARAGYKNHKVVGGLNEGYVVTLHHTHPDGKKEEFHYKIKSAKSNKHAGRIARLIHDKKNIPNKFVSFEPSKDVKLIEQSELEESRGHKLLSKALARMDTRKKIASGEIKVGAKRDEPPFDNAHPTGEKKDEFGNVVKNRAQHLAKKGMSSVSESDDLDESPSEYSANSYLAGTASGKKSGHYLKRGGSYVDHVAHPTVDHATKAWHNLKDKSGVKIVKETNNMLSYSEFVAKLEEGKIDDLKDRLAAAREKRLSSYDFSKEKGGEKPGVTVHRSKNYGNDEEDGDEKPEVQSTEKRGRGRPKGSKSGARV